MIYIYIHIWGSISISKSQRSGLADKYSTELSSRPEGGLLYRTPESARGPTGSAARAPVAIQRCAALAVRQSACPITQHRLQIENSKYPDIDKLLKTIHLSYGLVQVRMILIN